MAGLSQTQAIRLFFALWPDIALQRALGRIAKDAVAACGGRVSRTDTLHMTLLFLGAVETDRLDALKAAAARVSSRSFPLELETLACWPGNRIVYMAPAFPNQPLDDLVMLLRRDVRNADFKFDRRKFTPHVTLLRNINRTIGPQQLTPLYWPVREFSLMASIRTGQGNRYERLATWPLAAEAPTDAEW